ELDKSAAPPSPPANTPELVASAQTELARLGCYSGDSDGKLDAATKGAIKKYQAEREQPVTGIAVTDGFVHELRKLKLRVCPAAAAEKPKGKNNPKKGEPRTKQFIDIRTQTTGPPAGQRQTRTKQFIDIRTQTKGPPAS